MKIIRFLFSLIIPGILLTSCISLKPVEFKGIDYVRIGNVSNGKITLTSGVIIDNRNDFAFYLKNIDLTLTANDQQIADIHESLKITLAAYSLKIYDVPVEVDISGLFTNSGMLKLLASGKDLDIHFKGQLKVGKFIFTKKLLIDTEQKIPLKDLL